MPALSTTYSLDNFIELGKKVSITYDKFSTIETIGHIKFPIHHVVNDYLRELKNMAVTVQLTEKEYYRYRFRPKLLAYDVYNSTELDFVILAANNLADMKEFDLQQPKLLRKSDISNLLSYIYNTEKEFILSNRS